MKSFFTFKKKYFTLSIPPQTRENKKKRRKRFYNVLQKIKINNLDEKTRKEIELLGATR